MCPDTTLGSYICGPSYLSSLYALDHYGMIPERVYAYTSATYNKRKTKQYDTPFGTYIYRDVPKTAYPFAIRAEHVEHDPVRRLENRPRIV